MKTFRKTLLLMLILITTGQQIYCQEDAYVDSEGVVRWSYNDRAVKGFGVNYSVPFAHAYRTGKKLGVDLKQAIDNDLYHFSRLGFDLYRIHVWDTEISDEKGNLLENEHLELFDYLISELKKRDINYVLTPIAFWGNGWPEPDEDTPGFSDKYGKERSLTDPEAIKAQENYLAAFLNHVNPYTGLAYKEDPNVIAFEVSNEPHHRGEPEQVRNFIERMIAAMRSTGTEKPIFYNVSHSIHLAKTYAESGIDGGTFQWYPTGLGFGKELEGNLLPNVSDYEIPFDGLWRQKGLAKLVYEFDAADVMKSYMYPVMARSFRQAGIQFGTHFAYDPTYMAYANTEYNTHYMNLAYTPSKALGLMIAGKVFHEVPLYEYFGGYPDNLSFGEFLVDYKSDLALYNSGKEYIYSNDTKVPPESIQDLKQIAGYGESPVVSYDGKGAYFLDKLKEGLWRLEVMPDALVVEDPFGQNSLQRTVAVIKHRPWKMEVRLPDLGTGFRILGINEGNSADLVAQEAGFTVEPGTFLLYEEDTELETAFEGWEEDELRAFVAPETTVEQVHLVHEPVVELSAEQPLKISAEIVSADPVQQVEAWFKNGNTYETAVLHQKEAYTYTAKVPQNLLKPGFLDYRFIVTTENGTFTFPGRIPGTPGDWDFKNSDQFRTRIVNSENPVYLFEGTSDSEYVVGEWLPGLNVVPTGEPGQAEYQVRIENLFTPDPENLYAEPIYDYSFRYNFKNKIRGRKQDLRSKKKLVLKARALNEEPVKLQVAFVTEKGAAFGKIIEVRPDKAGEYVIPLEELEPVGTVLLPRPYPSFLPYYFEHQLEDEFELEEAEALQFSIGPGLSEAAQKKAHAVGIISARLEE